MEIFEPKSVIERALFSTVKIEVEFPDGKRAYGTGFIVSEEIVEGKRVNVIVTNKHVIEGTIKGKFLFHIKDSSSNGVYLNKAIQYDLDNFESLWIKHPKNEIDIAIFVITKAFIEDIKCKVKEDIYYINIPKEIIPKKANLISNFDAVEDIIFIGYPSGMIDLKNLIPITRKGTTATPIYFDFNGLQQFLIDAAVFPGSSGSPVFINRSGARPLKEGGIGIGGPQFYFVGILSLASIRFDQIEYLPIQSISIEDLKSKHFINLGYVFKPELIFDLILEVFKKA